MSWPFRSFPGAASYMNIFNNVSIVIPFPFSVIGYTLLLSLIEYKTLVMRGDLEQAIEVLPSIPKEHLNR